jgi:acyl carrier protein
MRGRTGAKETTGRAAPKNQVGQRRTGLVLEEVPPRGRAASDALPHRVPSDPSTANAFCEGMMGSIEETIRGFIAESILFSDNGYVYSDDASFLEEGIVDSMGIMELVMFVGDTFRITVEDEELVPDNFDSVSRLASYIRLKAPLETWR